MHTYIHTQWRRADRHTTSLTATSTHTYRHTYIHVYTVEVRGQTYHIIDCDEYTRNWFSEQQMEQPAGLRAPSDPYEIRETQEKRKRRDYEQAKQRRMQAEMMHKEEVKHRSVCVCEGGGQAQVCVCV